MLESSRAQAAASREGVRVTVGVKVEKLNSTRGAEYGSESGDGSCGEGEGAGGGEDGNYAGGSDGAGIDGGPRGGSARWRSGRRQGWR